MRNSALVLAVAGCLTGHAVPGDAADTTSLDTLLEIEGDVAWGEYLSSECTACHSDADGRIPRIAGLPGDYMLSALHDYRTGARENAIMQNVAQALSDDEMAALSAYFETVEP